MPTQHQKREISLRYWLQGRGYFLALAAMDFAKEYHMGLRKDGVTPEFDHQVSICQYLRTLDATLRDPQETYIAALLHDVREDYDVSDVYLRTRFGDAPADAVEYLSKEIGGVRKEDSSVFDEIARSPIASLVKGADRIHNHQTMDGVFSREKQIDYVAETDRFFFPMLKSARRLFPDQEPAYENMKLVLRTQVDLVRQVGDASPQMEFA